MPSSIMTRAQKHFARFPPLAAPSMLNYCPFSSAQSTRNPYCFPCIIRHGAGRGTDAPGDALALASALFGAQQHASCPGRHVTSRTFADQPAMRIQCLPSRSVLLRRELGAGTSHFLSPAKRCPMTRCAFCCFHFETMPSTADLCSPCLSATNLMPGRAAQAGSVVVVALLYYLDHPYPFKSIAVAPLAEQADSLGQ